MKLIVKTLLGAEQILGKELENLGAVNVETQRRAVSCEADKETLYKICYCSRLAVRVMICVLDFHAENVNEIYNAVYAYEWDKVISSERTICIDHVSFSKTMTDSEYIGQKVMEAICDKLNETAGRRPIVDNNNPQVLINAHVSDERVTIAVDACGAPLSRRGYRPEVIERKDPLGDGAMSRRRSDAVEVAKETTNEVLAAILIELSGWTPDQSLIDPMCGAGTICIEAAMKARNIPSQSFRKYPFGFEFLLDFDPMLWEKVKNDAAALRTDKQRLRIVGSDVDTDMLDVAKMTTLDMKLTNDVRISRRSIREQSRMTQEGIVITCPPTNPDATRRGLEDLYKEATHYLSRNFLDHDVWIYTTSADALDAIPFDADKEIEVADGYFYQYPF